MQTAAFPVSSANTSTPAIYAPAVHRTQQDRILKASKALRSFLRVSQKWEIHEGKVHAALNRHLQTVAETVYRCRPIPLTSGSPEAIAAIDQANLEVSALRTAIKEEYKAISGQAFDDIPSRISKTSTDEDDYIHALLYLAFPAVREQDMDKESDSKAWNRAHQKKCQYTNAIRGVLAANKSSTAASWIAANGGLKKVAKAYADSKKQPKGKNKSVRTFNTTVQHTSQNVPFNVFTDKAQDTEWVVTVSRRNGNTLDLYEVLTDKKLLRAALIAAGITQEKVEAFFQADPGASNDVSAKEAA